MVIDTSALVAILFDEPEAARLVSAIDATELRRVPATAYVEAAIVTTTRIGRGGQIALDSLVERLDLTIVAVSPTAARFARSGYLRFGTGVGRPGVLNFGDSFSYGVAKELNDSLLFVGTDFSRTDVVAAEY